MNKLLCSIIIIGMIIIAIEIIARMAGDSNSNRAVMKPSSRDITLQPAKNRNIYLRPNGPESGIFIGDVNILHVTDVNTPKRVVRKQDMLENQLKAIPQAAAANFTALLRIIDGLRLRILFLERVTSLKLGCSLNVCANGGTCLDLIRGYHCICPSNWEGKNCDVDVNECRNFEGTDLGCQNEATCINKDGSYECVCKAGWYGIHCTRKLKDCSGGHFEMCGHGTCIGTTSGEGITCTCDQGWTSNGTGLPCLSDVDECDAAGGVRCSTNPKVECVNLPGSFRCGECPAGYSGDGFSCTVIDIDE